MIARPNVPNLFAVSPFLAMRSAPTTTASIRPRPKRLATAASGSTACAMPSRPSSHAVRRAPCSSGRVSGTQTNGARPSACNRRTTPNAVTCAMRSPKHPRYRLRRSAHPLQTIRHRAHPSRAAPHLGGVKLFGSSRQTQTRHRRILSGIANRCQSVLHTHRKIDSRRARRGKQRSIQAHRSLKVRSSTYRLLGSQRHAHRTRHAVALARRKSRAHASPQSTSPPTYNAARHAASAVASGRESPRARARDE